MSKKSRICAESSMHAEVHLGHVSVVHNHMLAQRKLLLHQLAMGLEICSAASWLVKVKLAQVFHPSQHHRSKDHRSTRCHNLAHRVSSKDHHHHKVRSSQVHTDHQCRTDIQLSHRSQLPPQEELLSVKMDHQDHQEEDQAAHQRLQI